MDVVQIWEPLDKDYRIGVIRDEMVHDVTEDAIREANIPTQRNLLSGVLKATGNPRQTYHIAHSADLMYRLIENAVAKGCTPFEFFSAVMKTSDLKPVRPYIQSAIPPHLDRLHLTNAIRTPLAVGIGVSYMVSAAFRTAEALGSGTPTGDYELMAYLTSVGDTNEVFIKAANQGDYSAPFGQFGVSMRDILLKDGTRVPIMAASEAELVVLFDMGTKRVLGYMPGDDFCFDLDEKRCKLGLPIDKKFAGGALVHNRLTLVEDPMNQVPNVNLQTRILDEKDELLWEDRFSTRAAVFSDTDGDGHPDYGGFFRTTQNVDLGRLLLAYTGAGAMPKDKGKILRPGYKVVVGIEGMPPVWAVGRAIPEHPVGNVMNPDLDWAIIQSLQQSSCPR